MQSQWGSRFLRVDWSWGSRSGSISGIFQRWLCISFRFHRRKSRTFFIHVRWRWYHKPNQGCLSDRHCASNLPTGETISIIFKQILKVRTITGWSVQRRGKCVDPSAKVLFERAWFEGLQCNLQNVFTLSLYLRAWMCNRCAIILKLIKL